MKKEIQVRKIILVSLIAVLSLVLILQLAIKGNNDAYHLTLKNTLEKIEIQKGNGELILLVNTEDGWYLDEDDALYSANDDVVKILTDYLASIPVIGKVSFNSDDERYGFGANSSIIVKAFRKGKVVRTLEIGKNSVSNQQVYGRIDEKNEVLLIGGNPRNVFDRTEAQLRAE